MPKQPSIARSIPTGLLILLHCWRKGCHSASDRLSVDESSREGDPSGDTCLFKEGDEFHSQDKGLLLSELGKDTDMPEGNGYGAITEFFANQRSWLVNRHPA